MILFVLACSSGSPEKAEPVNQDNTSLPATEEAEPLDTDMDTDTGTPDLPTITQDPVTATMSAEDVVQAIEKALSTPPDPGPIVDTYIELMAAGDDTCPGTENVITDTWLYGCVSETGYSYAGITDWTDEETDIGGQLAQLTVLAGDFWIDTPDGHQLEGGGHAARVKNNGIWIGAMAGSWRWTAGADWLSYGYSGNLVIESIESLFISMEGAVDINGTYITAHNLIWYNVCDGGTEGALSLRDPSGGWYRIEFEACTPCGNLTFQGSDMGEVCIDFSNFITAITERL